MTSSCSSLLFFSAVGVYMCVYIYKIYFWLVVFFFFSFLLQNSSGINGKVFRQEIAVVRTTEGTVPDDHGHGIAGATGLGSAVKDG